MLSLYSILKQFSREIIKVMRVDLGGKGLSLCQYAAICQLLAVLDRTEIFCYRLTHLKESEEYSFVTPFYNVLNTLPNIVPFPSSEPFKWESHTTKCPSHIKHCSKHSSP